MAHAIVTLNVYNMHWLNEYISTFGIGIFHSGIEVHGKEYAFGGHPYDFTGIFDMEPKDVEELGDEFLFKESILLGYTDFTEADIRKLISNLGRSYEGSSYHLVKKNCNHFTNEFSKLICGKDIPTWVNRLATIGIRFPFLAACIPKEWLTPDLDTPFNDYIDMREWVEIDMQSIKKSMNTPCDALGGAEISLTDYLKEMADSRSNLQQMNGVLVGQKDEV